MQTVAHWLNVAIEIEVILIVIRVITSWIPDLDPWHPAMKLLRGVTDPVLRIFRPLLPTFSGIDVTPLVAILVLQTVGGALGDYASGFYINFTQALVHIVIAVLLGVIAIVAVIVFIRLVLSMLRPDPWHPTTRLIRDMSRPLVQPFAAVLPRTRAFDTAALCALLVFIALYVGVDSVGGWLLRHV